MNWSAQEHSLLRLINEKGNKMKKKELVMPESWQHQVVEAVIASLDLTISVDMLTLEQGSCDKDAISILVTPNNALTFAVNTSNKWQRFNDFDELAKSGCYEKTIERIYFGLFKYWQCLQPEKASSLLAYHELYTGIVDEAVNDKTSETDFDKLVYVTGHLYRHVKRLMLKEVPDWSVAPSPITYRGKPLRPSMILDR